jgi:hypothetical protein
MAKKTTKKKKVTLTAGERAILAGANADTTTAYAPRVSALNREISVEAGQRTLIDRAYDAYRAELKTLEGQRQAALAQARAGQAAATAGAQGALSAAGQAQQGYLGQQAQITGGAPVDASAAQADLNASLALGGQRDAYTLAGLGAVEGDYAGRAMQRTLADEMHQIGRSRERMAGLRTKRTDLAGEIGAYRQKRIADRTQQEEENQIAAASVRFKRDQQAFDEKMERLKYQADRDDASDKLQLSLADDERADRALDMQDRDGDGKKDAPRKNRWDDKWQNRNTRLIALRDSYGKARDGGNHGDRKLWARKGEGAWRKSFNKGETEGSGGKVTNDEIILIRELTTGTKNLRTRRSRAAAERIFGKGRVPKWMLE